MGKIVKGIIAYLFSKLGLGLATAGASYAASTAVIDYIQSNINLIPESALIVFNLLRMPEAISMILSASVASNVVKVVKK